MNLSAIILFDDNLKELLMNSSIEVAKFEPGTTIENTNNEIKYNHLKIITSAAMDLSAINLFDKNIEQLSMNRRIEVARFEPEPTFENTIYEIKENRLKSITYIDMNSSSITSNKTTSSSEHLKSYLMPWILLQSL